MITACARLISSGFGSGYSRKAPGTVGSVVAVGLWLLLAWAGAVSLFYHQAILACIVAIGGTVAVWISLKKEGDSDPQWIVIDEWAGVLIALIGTSPANYLHVCAALVLFRVFDIWKPGPVGGAEGLPGAWGVMGDDLVAGVLALIGMVILRSF